MSDLACWPPSEFYLTCDVFYLITFFVAKQLQCAASQSVSHFWSLVSAEVSMWESYVSNFKGQNLFEICLDEYGVFQNR